MAKKWRTREFNAPENIVGHGKEKIANEICDFLNDHNVGEEGAMVASYQSTDHKGNALVHAILWYYK